MIRCNDVRGRLRAHLDGELRGVESARVRQHLEACAGCSAELERIDVVAQAIRSIPHDEAPAHFTANLQVRLASARARAGRPAWRRFLPGSWALPPNRWRLQLGAAGAAVLLVVAVLAGVLTSQRRGVAEIARDAEQSWSKIHNYSCVFVTRGVYQGRPRRFDESTWFQKPGYYRLETRQDYRLVTVIGPTAIRHYIQGGDWRGRGPLVIVRPRTEALANVSFRFGVTWPAGPNVTIGSLLRQLRSNRGAELLSDQEVQGTDCYVAQFEALPPGGSVPEQCTIWIAKDTLLPVRIRRYRDANNDLVQEAVDLRPNTTLPSNVFQLDPPPGAVVIEGDVDPHVFALKPAERTGSFDRQPLTSTATQIALRAEEVPFGTLAPRYLPEGYRLVRVRRSPGRWMDIHWILERQGEPARVIRLTEQPAAGEEPVEARGGRLVNLGPEAGAVTARVREGKQPYGHCFVAWRTNGTQLTLATVDLPLAETLKIARSMHRVFPGDGAGPRELVGPPAPGDMPTVRVENPLAISLLSPPHGGELFSATFDPPMMPDAAEAGEDAGRTLY